MEKPEQEHAYKHEQLVLVQHRRCSPDAEAKPPLSGWTFYLHVYTPTSHLTDIPKASYIHSTPGSLSYTTNSTARAGMANASFVNKRLATMPTR